MTSFRNTLNIEKMTDNIKIRVVQPQEYERAVNFLIEHFYRDEPLSCLEPKIVPSETDRADILACLKCGTSLLAVQINENGEEELVAVNAAIPKDPSSIEKYFQTAEKEGNTKYGQVMKLLGVAQLEADLFNRYGVDKVFYTFMTCVKPSMRGKNLGFRLKQELMELGRRLGLKVLTGDCTSFYSARLFDRMGWNLINSILYQDYVDENNEPVFKPPPPHIGVQTYAVSL